jgi:serine/threonine protein kinase
VVWKRLEHPNIVPFLGITSVPLQLISEWMPGGDLTEYVKKYPGVGRLGLVGVHSMMFDPMFIPATSYLMSQKAFTFSTPAT